MEILNGGAEPPIIIFVNQKKVCKFSGRDTRLDIWLDIALDIHLWNI